MLSNQSIARTLGVLLAATHTLAEACAGPPRHGVKVQGRCALVHVWEGALREGCCSALRFSIGQLMDAAAESPPALVHAHSWLLRAVWTSVEASALFSEVSSPWHNSAPRLLLCLRLENPFPQGALYTGFIFQRSANKFLPNCPNE